MCAGTQMDFDVIGGADLDRARTKRLLGSYAAGVLLCGACIGLAAGATASPPPTPSDDDVIDVKLAQTAEEVAPEPPPPPPKVPDIEPPKPVGRAQIAAPTVVPTTAPD